jgi:hypothetical protein
MNTVIEIYRKDDDDNRSLLAKWDNGELPPIALQSVVVLHSLSGSVVEGLVHSVRIDLTDANEAVQYVTATLLEDE